MKRHTKTLVAGLVAGLVLLPTTVDARVVSTPRVSTPVRVSTPRVSVPRVSTPRVSTPKVSTPKVSTPKVTTSKPSSIKSGTSTLKPSKGTTVPRVNKSTTNKSTTKNNTTVKSTNKSAVKVDSGNYSVKKKTNTKAIVPVTNNYYNDYSTSRLGYNSNLRFWQYYGLTHMMHDNVSERDIAKELTKKGYTKSEINSILKDAKKEHKSTKKKGTVLKVLSLVAISVILLFIFL